MAVGDAEASEVYTTNPHLIIIIIIFHVTGIALAAFATMCAEQMLMCSCFCYKIPGERPPSTRELGFPWWTVILLRGISLYFIGTAPMPSGPTGKMCRFVRLASFIASVYFSPLGEDMLESLFITWLLCADLTGHVQKLPCEKQLFCSINLVSYLIMVIVRTKKQDVGEMPIMSMGKFFYNDWLVFLELFAYQFCTAAATLAADVRDERLKKASDGKKISDDACVFLEAFGNLLLPLEVWFFAFREHQYPGTSWAFAIHILCGLFPIVPSGGKSKP